MSQIPELRTDEQEKVIELRNLIKKKHEIQKRIYELENELEI